jgi:Na+-driven multidrug efflux pump
VGIQQSIIGFSNVFVQSYINVFGSSCMAGWSCYSKLDQYMMLPMQSLGQAATTFTGQNLGAGKLDRAKKGTWVAFGICLFVTSIAAVMLHYFAPELSALFTKDASVIAYGAGFIRLCAPFAILCTFNQVLSGTLRGAGDSRGPMLLTLCSHVFIRQIYLFIISRIFPDSVKVIAFGYPFGWILCAIIMTIYYRFSGWEKKCLQLK